MSKNQVMHEQKFKDPLSSTCPLSSERSVLDLESEVHERPRFNTFWEPATSCVRDKDATTVPARYM